MARYKVIETSWGTPPMWGTEFDRYDDALHHAETIVDAVRGRRWSLFARWKRKQPFRRNVSVYDVGLNKHFYLMIDGEACRRDEPL
jgi:hypothetical protein